MLNKLLQKQVQKFLGDVDQLSEDQKRFFEVVSESYEHYEKDRKMLERSMELSSSEMIELHTKLRKETEESKKAHHELKTLFENIEEVFFSLNKEKHELLQISKACIKVYGYSPEEFVKNPDLWKEVILAEDKHILDEKYVWLRKGSTVACVYRIRNKSGKVHWVETKLIPTLNKEGKLVRLDGVTSDFTNHKEMELALQNNEQKFRLIETTADAILVINEASEITYVSDSFYKITDYSYEDVMGIPVTTVLHKDSQDESKEQIKKLISVPGQSKVIVRKMLKKDGSYFWSEGAVTNLLNDPVVNGLVFNFRDITERKEYEKALETSNDELRKSNHELDKFVYSTSHDLRAPLMSMEGIVELTAEETNEELTASHMQMLLSSIHKLDKFIAEILNYSRNSRLEVRHEPIDFKDLLHDITNHLQYMNGKVNPFDIRIDVKQEGTFSSDRSRLTMLLNNLISNSIRYYNAKQEKTYVNINVKTQDDMVHIEVEDNGIGISKEYHQKIFDMFYKVSENSNGSGLGLYIVKETVDKLKGNIELESQPGIGTKFSVNIPNLFHQ